MFDTAQKKIRDAILRGELKAGDAVVPKGHDNPKMVIEYILESPVGKVARCWFLNDRAPTRGLFPLESLEKIE